MAPCCNTGWAMPCLARQRAYAPMPDPWKSTETCRMVFIEVDGEAPENRNPVPRRESEELQQVCAVAAAGSAA